MSDEDLPEHRGSPPQEPFEDTAAPDRLAAEDFEEHTPAEIERQSLFRLEGLASLETSYDVSGQGSNIATYGNQYNVQQFSITGRTARLVTTLPPEQVRDIAARTVPTQSQRRLAERLHDTSVVLLRGRPESGWRTTAYAALLERIGKCTGTPLAILHTDTNPAELRAQDLDRADGFLLDARNAPWLAEPDEAITQLRMAAHAAGRLIVVLVTEVGAGCEHSVVHVPPAPMDVFQNWLDHWLHTTEAWKEHGLDEYEAQLMEILDRCSPGRARELALDLATGIQAGKSVGQMLETQRQPLREKLQHALGDTASPFSRCFLVSSGVLHRLRESTVSGAALQLEALVREKENERNRPGPPVWESLRELLVYNGLQTEPPSAAGDGHSVWLRPEARAQVLHVVWEEVPALRSILIDWLRELTGRKEWEVAIRAAQAVGQLAACDFNAIRREFLEPWSESGYSGNRLVMAALEAASLDADLRRRVHHLLEVWSNGNYKRRTTAAMTYGSQIGVRAIDKALPAFNRVVAHSRSKHLHALVARAVTETHVATTADRITRELRRWATSDSYGLRRTAAVAFTSLAHLPNGFPGRPALVESTLHSEMAALWCHALDWSKPALPDPEGRLPTPPVLPLLAGWAGRTSCQPVVEEIFRAVGTRHRQLRLPFHVHLRAWQARGIITTAQRAVLGDLLK
ncbi:hypothetical protein Misp01_29880 [Microtetraspora sp. NBRC 13810]|uniref:hypothetical protein n=1 Tax=Microtetraspora sp. NBRC 13810 TaxID=3030990 RepID=UPI0024A43AF9|nr:hypothetical protein [Microtetraspora sp. NBRC 13810]GLW07858.1 hypothetical protein Misp01_29880 [Microtetraspora sp. NBRC 13810]